jgi:dolichol-phosphate mannosyltransferase
MAERNLFIVLPAYNEEADLPPLLDRIPAAMSGLPVNYRVIVVDDGSADRTLEIAREYAEKMPLDIVIHEQNMGLGATIRDGLKAGADRAGDNDLVVSLDADNSHSPELIADMLPLIDSGADVVIASRYQPGAEVRGLAWHREMLSLGVRWLFCIILPIKGVRDYSCGFRAYTGSTLKAAFDKHGDDLVSEEGFSCMVDILLKLRKMEITFAEVPMVLRYDLKDGASKMNVPRTVIRTLKLLISRRFSG